jgi:ribonuclease P protein component
VHASPAGDGVRVGFAVNRAVGGAVVRNRVKRRLRAAVRQELQSLQRAGSWDIVVRATPRAADAAFDQLTTDLATTLAVARSVAR